MFNRNWKLTPEWINPRRIIGLLALIAGIWAYSQILGATTDLVFWDFLTTRTSQVVRFLNSLEKLSLFLILLWLILSTLSKINMILDKNFPANLLSTVAFLALFAFVAFGNESPLITEHEYREKAVTIRGIDVVDILIYVWPLVDFFDLAIFFSPLKKNRQVANFLLFFGLAGVLGVVSINSNNSILQILGVIIFLVGIVAGLVISD